MRLHENDRYNEYQGTFGGAHAYQGVSVASEMTYHAFPGYDVCLDLGHSPLSTTTFGNVFITHGHNDHCGGLVKHMWRRSSWGLPAANYYAVGDTVHLLREVLAANCRLSRTRTVPDLIKEIKLTDTVKLKGNLEISPFKGHHRIPCYGYVLRSRRNKLLPEYVGVPGPELAKLKKEGVQITSEFVADEIAYTGDTSIEIFKTSPFLLKSRVLIVECTGIDDLMDQDSVRKSGHIHIEHLADLFRENEVTCETIVLTHFSARYSTRDIERAVSERLSFRRLGVNLPLVIV
jgi:ribonuclease Z